MNTRNQGYDNERGPARPAVFVLGVLLVAFLGTFAFILFDSWVMVLLAIVVAVGFALLGAWALSRN